ncbi:hypothetical protein FOVG_19332 [Fusarium oxysporum f. sp. pisi HDV247]|uniref:Uncharacterized protein n=1 Tax=Fusarium oxysporum f. sp. pisi HDV247 TaxID=1080344 RepID=W9N916_FUSOX|nr:hypothetical protein FOVG_19332 [Fusarium oxysporum f. sp. pisi HDV247]
MAPNKRIILITGANSGIGYDTSYALANDSPDNHIIMGARSSVKGLAALNEIQARKPAGTLSFLELDITSDESIKARLAINSTINSIPSILWKLKSRASIQSIPFTAHID